MRRLKKSIINVNIEQKSAKGKEFSGLSKRRVQLENLNSPSASLASMFLSKGEIVRDMIQKSLSHRILES